MNREKKNEYNKRYYREHKDQVIEYTMQWKRKNPERIAAHQRQYYERNAERIKGLQKAYRERNRETYAECGAALRDARIKAGLSQKKLGQIIGVTSAAISSWERGVVPIAWDDVVIVFPELQETMQKARKTE